MIKIDPITELPIRSKEGFCIHADINEPGEMIGFIDQTHPFVGYTDPNSTKKKVQCSLSCQSAADDFQILTDVFGKGDQFFRTGDLMRVDAEGFVFFVDRIGDTFRWKGENVSTTEVAAVASKLATVQEVNVYGVTVPEADGRCGMIAVKVSSDPAAYLGQWYQDLSVLPAYARPVFVRILLGGQWQVCW